MDPWVDIADGDLTGDGIVDAADAQVVITSWGPVDPPGDPADFNMDGWVDAWDAQVVVANWGGTPQVSEPDATGLAVGLVVALVLLVVAIRS